MICPSVAGFINSKPEFSLPNIALKAFAKTPNLVLGELRAPFCLVTPLTDATQELWELGDAHRQEHPIIQVGFYATSEWQMRHYETIFRRYIESAKTIDIGGLIHPGIDYLAFADFLRDSGDHMTYFSDQPNWFASPDPVVYVNTNPQDEPIIMSGSTYGEGGFGEGNYGGSFAVDLATGSVTFESPLSASDLARASYKIGVIDFNILGVAHFETSQDSDMANNPARFVVTFDLEAFYLVKANANRYL